MYDKDRMLLAIEYSNKSKDPTNKTAALFFDNKSGKLITYGVNSLFNENNILKNKIWDYVHTIKNIKKYVYKHAEIDCIERLKYKKINVKNKNIDIYITNPPCLACMCEMLINNDINVKNIYYLNNCSKSFVDRYYVYESIKLAKEMKIEITPITNLNFEEDGCNYFNIVGDI